MCGDVLICCCVVLLLVRYVLLVFVWLFFFFKQKTAYEMRISDWSSDVCSSDLNRRGRERPGHAGTRPVPGPGDPGAAELSGRRRRIGHARAVALAADRKSVV